MAHAEQRRFIESVRRLRPGDFAQRRVLELGSRSINGSVRGLFQGCEYIGLDAVSGPLVDVVSPAHEFQDSRGFDVVISCEAFEHDPWLDRTLAALPRLLRSGLFVGTCAGPARAEHGTRRSSGETAIYGPEPDYYRNVGLEDLLDELVRCAAWERLHVEYGRSRRDLYWYGVLSSPAAGRSPTAAGPG
ncbi:MAG: hypothetical protein KF774_19210 [Planctomyces sp.]|nr:hypothetical protein [Planctomyces sp.]